MNQALNFSLSPRAAELMLKRAQALGITDKAGKDVVVDIMDELLAAAHGFRNAHTFRAARKKQNQPATSVFTPGQVLVDAKPGEGFIAMNEPNAITVDKGSDCWIGLGAFVIHPNLTDEGIVVDVYPRGSTQETIASTWVELADVEPALCDAHDIVPEDVEAFASENGVRLDSSEYLSIRLDWYDKYLKSLQETNRDARLLKQWESVLEDLGYSFEEVSPNRWKWIAVTDEADSLEESHAEAIASAWRDAAEQAMAVNGMSEAEWDALSFYRHQELLRELAD